MYGENPDYDYVFKSLPAFFLYFISSNLIVIIALNILISIVTDRYEDVMTHIKAFDNRKLADLMESNEKMFFKNTEHSKRNDQKYLFVILDMSQIADEG